MPIYEYECKECGNRFEKMQPITADPLKDCPHCGKSAIQRVFHPVGVIFKGSGWYITDSRKGGDSASSSAKSDSGKESSTASSESKSEASSSKESSTTGASQTKSTES